MYPVSKMRRRWKIHYYKPKEITFEVLKRATKYKVLVWPECRSFIELICNRYSNRPQATMHSLIPSHLLHEQMFIKNGIVINQRDAEISKEARIWSEKINSGLESFWHSGDCFCRCNSCGMYEVEAFSGFCIKCSKKSMQLFKKEQEIKEVKSLINKVKKLCQDKSKQRVI